MGAEFVVDPSHRFQRDLRGVLIRADRSARNKQETCRKQ